MFITIYIYDDDRLIDKIVINKNSYRYNIYSTTYYFVYPLINAVIVRQERYVHTCTMSIRPIHTPCLTK